MNSEVGPLSKQDLFWLQITTMAERLDVLVKALNVSEKNVGNTATSIEESLSSMREQLEALVGTAEGVMTQKELELQRRLDASVASAQEAIANRDLEVISTITEGVEAKIQSSLDEVVKTLKDSTDDTIGRIRTAAVQSVNSTADAGRYRWLAGAISVVVVLVVVCCALVWWKAAAYYEQQYEQKARELLFSGGKEAEAAVKFSRFNDLSKMVNCEGFETHKQGGQVFCVPMSKDKVVSGWRVE